MDMDSFINEILKPKRNIVYVRCIIIVIIDILMSIYPMFFLSSSVVMRTCWRQ